MSAEAAEPPIAQNLPAEEITHAPDSIDQQLNLGGGVTGDNEEITHAPDSIDRRTLFDDGLLVLTPKDLILYTSDERDELKRIPVSTIQSCGYSVMRRCLLIKRRVNEDDNFQKLLAEKNSTLGHLERRKLKHEEELRRTRVRSQRQEIKENIRGVEQDLNNLSAEIKQLKTDPTKTKLAQEKTADIKNETFRLPKSLIAPSRRNHREEYRIWEYAVRRRLSGVPRIKIDSLPYDAVVVIDGRVFGTTPLTIDKPLIDDAILKGKYSIKLLKEGYDTVKLQVTANVAKGSHLEKVELHSRKKPDYQLDKQTKEMRRSAPDRSIDLSVYGVEREVEGRHELLLLASDEMLICTKDREQCLYEIPYGSINDVRYDGGFLRGNKAVKINYNETHFKNLGFDFWIDDQDGRISSSELKQRSESLAEILNRKRKESKILDIPNRIRAPAFFIVTENDIQNNFSRFEPFEFERLVAKLFEKKGYKTTVTQERGDFGVDVLAEAGGDKIAIQVKHWQASVGGPDVHKTLGSMLTFGATRAMVVTSSDFTNQAREIQRRGAPVELWNGSKLRDEFRQHLLEAQH